MGEGAHARVFLCEHKLTITRYAVKIMEKRILGKEKVDNYYKEIRMVRSLLCPYIIYIYEFFEDEERIYVVMEYCAGGSLRDSINTKKKEAESFTEKQVAWVMNQLMRGIAFMHANKICHRDIKPENILFMDGPPGHGVARVKIIDFGCARYFEDDKKMVDMYGSAYFLAPEMITGNYDCRVDVFSAGVIMYTMCTMKLPFDGRNDMEILNSILTK